MSGLLKGKDYCTDEYVNEGIKYLQQLHFEAQSATPADADLGAGRLYYKTGVGLYLYDGSSWILLGAAGAGPSSIPTLDAIFQGDQTLNLAALSTLTIDRSSGNNDILTLTNSGGGSGKVIQITNAGTGADIAGTAGTWSFSKAGVNVMKSTTIAGTAGSDSLVLTAGDAGLSDGSLTIVDADNAATLSVTNDTATSESPFVFAGAGAFTGTTTKSFMTITASGLTTGTALYMSAAAITQGKILRIAGGTTQTSGCLVLIESAANAITNTTGGLLQVSHSGTTGTNAILVGFDSVAADETVIQKITASGALTGTALYVSTAGLTGKGVLVDAASLTSGLGVSITSASTALTGAGRLLNVAHSGNATAGNTSKVVEFSSAAAEDTTIFQVTASAALAGGKVAVISAAAMTTGTALAITGMAAFTTGYGINLAASGTTRTDGILLNITDASTAATSTGRMVYVGHTGITGVSTILSEFASAAQDETVIFQVTASDVLAGGKAAFISAAAMTTGTALDISGMAAITTGKGINVTASGTTRTDGILVNITDASTAATSTGRMLYVGHTGATGVSTILSEFASAATDETVIVKVTASAANALGTALQVVSATTTGNGVTITTSSLTTGTGLSVAYAGTTSLTTGANLVSITSSSTASTATTRMLYVNHTGATSASGAGILSEFISVATDATTILKVTGSTGFAVGTIVSVSAAALTTGTALSLANADALTTGKIINATSNSSNAGARSLVYISNANSAAVLATPLTIVNAGVTGTGSKFKLAGNFCGYNIWVSIDGTSPNGALGQSQNTNVTAGDICLGTTGGKIAYCTSAATNGTWAIIT